MKLLVTTCGWAMLTFLVALTPIAAAQSAQDVSIGYWELVIGLPEKPAEQRKASVKLDTRADQKLVGTVEINGRSMEIDEAKFDPTSKKLVLNFGDQEHDYELSGSIVLRRLNAKLDTDFGREVATVTGWRIPLDAATKQVDAASLAGEWTGVLESDSIPAEVNHLTITLEPDQAKGFRGKLAAAGQNLLVDSGSWDMSTSELILAVHNDNGAFQGKARIVGDVIFGTFTIAGGAFKHDFSVERAKPKTAGSENAKSAESPKQ